MLRVAAVLLSCGIVSVAAAGETTLPKGDFRRISIEAGLSEPGDSVTTGTTRPTRIA